jgi:uroporphyrinogen decarboxylase
VMRRMQEQVGQTTALYGLVTGPLTLASHLRGTELFMDTFDRPDFLQELLAYCTSVCLRVSQMYIQAGMDVIAVVDPVVSQISPSHMERFLLNPYKEIFQSLRSHKVFSSIFVCGDATKNLDLLCQSGPDCLAVDENIDMKAARMVADNYQITLQGNIPLTSCMLLGSKQDNMKYVIDLIDSLCRQGESIPQNLIISPGCDMPYDVPAENVIGILQAIREPHTVRQMLANYHSRTIDLESIAIPDYAHLERPLVEVFTLDSSTCPTCGYMLMAAQRAARDLEGKMDMVEYKATSAENIARMARMGVKNLPAILINGELKFSSLIPGNAELVEAIRQKMP